MQLLAENYHSIEANLEYLSVSQYKDFVGTWGRLGCEAKALAILKGEWIVEKNKAMLMGGYIDAHFSGTLDLYKEKYPQIFLKKGGLKSDYLFVEDIISRVERDKLFMKYMSGRKQVIYTVEWLGAKWKVMIDSFIDDVAIVDLKLVESLTKAHYVKDYGYLSFVEYWGYDIQGAIYQKVIEIATGKKLPFFLASVSKEKEPDLEIIAIDNDRLSALLADVEVNVPRILRLKKGEEEPTYCGRCDYCRHHKVLREPIHYSALLQGI